MEKNIILNTDSYKQSHFLFYPPDTTEIYSYLESRGGRYPATIFAGEQGFRKEYLEGPVVTRANINEARDFNKLHGTPFNEDGWDYILNEFGGNLPIEIKAVPEGTLVPTRNVLATVRNTGGPKTAFLTSFIESALLSALWYPTTVATRVFGIKRSIKPYFDATSDSGFMGFALLDFSRRGCTSLEANEIAGAAHLMMFIGSDSIPAVRYVNKHYNHEMSGFSVAALEHSITTSWGDQLQEDNMLGYILEQMPENAIISLVGDTYDIFKFTAKLANHLDIIRRKNLTVVVRPDSGEIRDVLKPVIKTVDDVFGHQINAKGYAVFNGAKVLWGDGMNEDTVTEPFQIGKILSISSDCIMAGMGGGMAQGNIDRDTCKFAFKASNVIRQRILGPVSIPIAKDPITDTGKRSKKGKLALVRTGPDGEDFTTFTSEDINWRNVQAVDELQTTFLNGQSMVDDTMENIRARVDSYL